MSEAWRKDHFEEASDDLEPLDRIATTEESLERLNLDTELMSAVCAASGHATSTQRSADVCWKGKPEPTERADQSANSIEFTCL